MATVLLIDDDAELTRLVGDYLTREGFTVATAPDGSKALGRIIETRADIVVLDIMMPGPDGLEVLRRIRADERTALLPVVVLTTSKEHQDIFEAYRLGANSYIRKPVDFERFLQAVGQLGLYWLSLNDPSDPTAR